MLQGHTALVRELGMSYVQDGLLLRIDERGTDVKLVETNGVLGQKGGLSSTAPRSDSVLIPQWGQRDLLPASTPFKYDNE